MQLELGSQECIQETVQLPNVVKLGQKLRTLMPMTHAPETGTKNPYQKTCTDFLQVCHANRYRFFRYRNLVPSRTVFYSVQETMTKWRVLIGQTIASCVVCLYKLCCLLFHCFKINWGDSSLEKLIQKFCFQFHLVRKTVSEKWYQFSGTGFRYRFLVCVSLALHTNRSYPEITYRYITHFPDRGCICILYVYRPLVHPPMGQWPRNGRWAPGLHIVQWSM